MIFYDKLNLKHISCFFTFILLRHKFHFGKLFNNNCWHKPKNKRYINSSMAEPIVYLTHCLHVRSIQLFCDSRRKQSLGLYDEPRMEWDEKRNIVKSKCLIFEHYNNSSQNSTKFKFLIVYPKITFRRFVLCKCRVWSGRSEQN